MGVFTYIVETASVIPPARLFKAFVLDVDNLIPKVAPHAVKSVENVQGNGGPGTVKKITFGEGSQFKYVKQRVDEIDPTNFTYSYSVIEGDALIGTLERISYETKIVVTPDGGSIFKNTSKYHFKGDHEVTEEEVKAGKEKAAALFKAIEGYLLANPEAYN